MIDIHNHLQDPRLAPYREEVIREMKAAGLTRCVVNGTSPADWPEVAELALRHPDFITPAFGLHPWKTSPPPSSWERELRSFLADFPHAHLGECGLDRWMESPDIDTQKALFRRQLELAHELARPVAIHCLKAWGPLLDVLRDVPLPERSLLHSYGGSLEFARQLRQFGDPWFSFSGYFLHERKSERVEVFRHLPPERLLAESDAPDMAPPEKYRNVRLQLGNSSEASPLNHPANFPLITSSFLEKLGTGLSESSLRANARCFLQTV
ncbi:MAG: TatD family hydrolase [Verrucomicrobiales bacterium]